MAISRYIPKDIKKYKPKLFWGFTSRQVLSLLVAAVFIFLFLVIFKNLPVEMKIYLSSIPAIIPISFGFVQIYGMPLEKFIPEVYNDHFRGNAKRYKVSAPSLSLSRKQDNLKLNHKNKPLSVCRKK